MQPGFPKYPWFPSPETVDVHRLRSKGIEHPVLLRPCPSRSILGHSRDHGDTIEDALRLQKGCCEVSDSSPQQCSHFPQHGSYVPRAYGEGLTGMSWTHSLLSKPRPPMVKWARSNKSMFNGMVRPKFLNCFCLGVDLGSSTSLNHHTKTRGTARLLACPGENMSLGDPTCTSSSHVKIASTSAYSMEPSSPVETAHISGATARCDHEALVKYEHGKQTHVANAVALWEAPHQRSPRNGRVASQNRDHIVLDIRDG